MKLMIASDSLSVTISRSNLHPLNALLSMFKTDDGINTLLRLLHLENALLSIVDIPFAISIVSNEVQFSNVFSLRISNPLGRCTSLSELQFENVFLPIDLTPSEIFTVCNPLQLANASDSISVIHNFLRFGKKYRVLDQQLLSLRQQPGWKP